MTASLKQKTVNGFIWSFIDNFMNLGIQFVIGIILARLLSPREFGLIGMILIFIAVSQTFVDSGFSQALIRKKNCTQKDYSTVFYFNLIIGVAIYFSLFFGSDSIGIFFKEPELSKILKVFTIVVVIESLTIIQRTILIKRVDFKLQAKISILATVFAGLISIFMAKNGFGVWSLVALHLAKRSLNSLFLWFWNKWIPLWQFSIKSFKELFSFGSKLLISAIIDTTYRNIYLLVIGKFFSANELGFYTKADEFKRLPSTNIYNIISRVSYPVLSSIQDDIPRLKIYYKKLIRSTMLITFTLMLGMAAVAKPMITVLIGEKWSPSVVYLQMLSVVGMMYPLHALNLNMLQVQGRSDLFLKLELIKKALAIPVILIGVYFGIKAMIAGMIINTFISYYINSYWSGKLIGYSIREQLKDLFPSFSIAFTVMIGIYFFGRVLPLNDLMQLIIQIISAVMLIFLFCEITKFKDYIFIKELLLEKINKVN